MEMLVMCVYFMKIKSTPCSENGSAIQDRHARRNWPRSLFFLASVRRPCRTSQRAAVVPAASKRALTDILNSPELDAGFHLLYELKPPAAREQFDAWQKSHPEDLLGIAAEGEPAIV
jgi:hypothetical protein